MNNQVLSNKNVFILKLAINKTSILDRLKSLSKSASDADLARFLGVAPATLSNWKSRDSIDYDLVFSKCEGISLDWLLTGIGEMLRNQPTALTLEPTVIYKSDPRDAKIIALQEEKIRMLEEKLAYHAAVLHDAPAADIPAVGGAPHTVDPQFKGSHRAK